MNKKITIFITLVITSFQIGFGQQASTPETGVIYPEYMGVSRPLSDFFVNEEDELNAQTVFTESKDREHRTAQTFQFTAEDGPEYRNDESTIQKEQGNRSVFAPLTNWAGQTGGGSCPPDPSGAAGINHYVQSVNATPFKVFNKTTGATMGTIRQIGSLWSPAVGNMGDPIILYDKYADRWFVSQFGQASGNKIYIAISQTNDPTGSYYTYTYTSPEFPDYLKFSIWADGYYMTANTGTDRVFVFERDKMILGQTARSVYATFSTGTVLPGFFLPLPADADGVLPPVGTPCPLFWYTENSSGGGNVDGIKYRTATVNWVPTTPTLTFSATTTVPTAAFDGTYNSSWNDIRQSTSSSTLLDGIGGVIWYRAQWRQWTGYNTVVLCWGVKISSTQRSIKWVELRQTQPSGTWTLYQEGIYAPDALNRWVGSIAMDDNGSIGLAYACAGPTPATSVGLRYTGRLATDPLGQMTFAETVAFAGSGNMSQCGNRFGDYSQTSLDPNGTTFWHTGQYVLNGAPATRIYSFNLPLPTELREAKSELNYKVYQNGNALLVNADHLTENGQFVVDLFDVQGRKIDGQVVTANDNKIRTSFDVNNFTKGIYMVRIGKANTSFQKVIKVPIN